MKWHPEGLADTGLPQAFCGSKTGACEKHIIIDIFNCVSNSLIL